MPIKNPFFSEANLDNMLIRAGSTNSMSGGVLSTIQNVIKHPDYVVAPRAADIAVTVLTYPLGITDSIGVLYLPPQEWSIPDGTPVKVVSWGFESVSFPCAIFVVEIEILHLATLEI